MVGQPLRRVDHRNRSAVAEVNDEAEPYLCAAELRSGNVTAEAGSWKQVLRIIIEAEVVRATDKAPKDNPRFAITKMIIHFAQAADWNTGDCLWVLKGMGW